VALVRPATLAFASPSCGVSRVGGNAAAGRAPITTRAASRYCLSRLQFSPPRWTQLGRYEPAATISRFAATAFTKRAFPEIGSTIDHLREVLGDEAYEALASTGASMTNAAMTAIGEEVDFR
jgi:hypothetical protein